MIWLSKNALALYGAITGTIALLIAFFSYRHNVSRDKLKLRVSFAAHPNQAENLARLNTESEGASPWERPYVVEVYEVTVRNVGSIPAPLDDVGVIDKTGKKHQALVRRHVSRMNLLEPLSKSEDNCLEPRAARTFSIYLKRDEPLFVAVAGYAVDQTEKVWRS